MLKVKRGTPTKIVTKLLLIIDNFLGDKETKKKKKRSYVPSA